MGLPCHPRALVRQEFSSKGGVWGFLPATHPCLSPNPLLDCVTGLALSAWNLALLTAVAILGVLGTALDTGGSFLPSVLLLTSRQSHSGSLESWTRVLEVIWRPQVCRGWVEMGRSRGRRKLGSCHLCLCLSPGPSWGLLALCCSAVPLLVPWVVFWTVRRPFPSPQPQVSRFA